MEFKTGTGNSFENMFDSIDCPQRLESIEQAEVDDSWFFRQSSESGTKISLTHSEPSSSIDLLTDKLSIIEEDAEARCHPAPDYPNSQSPPAASPPDSAGAAAASAAAPRLLATESRCQLRSKWETLRIQRERQHDQLRQQRKDSMCRREQEQVQQLRAAAVPRAHPIRHYKPMRIQRSDKPLTVAKSPDFALSRRHRQRSQQLQEQPPSNKS